NASSTELHWARVNLASTQGRGALVKALEDAGIDYTEVEQAYVGYVYGESTAGQRAVYELGLTGIPIVNVNNNWDDNRNDYLGLASARKLSQVESKRSPFLGERLL
ncbi:MAG: Non-speCific lipid-transfer protein, partial [Candidatus Moranbacteria bacterium GW2011_GWF1_44_4]